MSMRHTYRNSSCRRFLVASGMFRLLLDCRWLVDFTLSEGGTFKALRSSIS